jgi:glutathione S-transferase
MVLDAVSELREQLKRVWVGSRLEPAAVQRYAATVLASEAELLASSEPGPGLACLERLLAGPPSTEGPAGAGMQGDSKASSSASAGAQTAAAAGEGGADDDGDGASLLSDDGAADGRLWFVGERISIADVAVADLVDLHLVHFEQQVKSTFPHLHLHWRRVMGQTGIKAYLASNNRHSLIWGQDWIDQHQGQEAKQQ